MDTTFPELVRKTILSKRRNDGPITNSYEGYFHLKVLTQRLFETIVENERDTEAIANVFVHVAALCQGAAEDLMFCPVDSMPDDVKAKLHTERQERIEHHLDLLLRCMQKKDRPLPLIQRGGNQEYSLIYSDSTINNIEEALEQ